MVFSALYVAQKVVVLLNVVRQGIKYKSNVALITQNHAVQNRFILIFLL